jgi:hypothetical protein
VLVVVGGGEFRSKIEDVRGMPPTDGLLGDDLIYCDLL